MYGRLVLCRTEPQMGEEELAGWNPGIRFLYTSRSHAEL